MAFWQMSGSSANGDQKALRSGDVEAAYGSSSRSSDAGSSSSSSSSRAPMKAGRAGLRKAGKNNGQQCSVVFFLAILTVVLITFVGSQYMVFVGFPGDSGSRDDFFDQSDGVSDRGSSVIAHLANLPFRILDKEAQQRQSSGSKRELRFGQGFRGREGDRDSRDWDTDDRDRSYIDEKDTFDEEYARMQQEIQGNNTSLDSLPRDEHTPAETTASKAPGLTYERGRKELKIYEEQYEAELNSAPDEDEDYDEDNDETPDDETVSIGRAAHEEKSLEEDESEDKIEIKPVKTHRSRRRGPCQINFTSNATKLREPENSSKFAKFELKYVTTEMPPPDEHSEWKPQFAGHQSLQERENSFLARNQTMHCGFIQGPDSFASTGFDISQRDRDFLASCRVAVSSCIFGKSDQLHTPRRRTLSSSSRKEACMVMFVDQSTLDVMVQEKQVPDEDGYVGLWRVVLVQNLPFSDLRLVGKIPKFLSHRLFPSARYSIWLDSKLRLQSDPLSILEYFLWRGNREYAISNHYDRHCVWDEVLQNKKLNKFNHTLIDEQFRFYQSDGLIKFNATDPGRLLPSYVPEGSLIIRAHTPMSNLFSCLWFNEAVRFTPRDQLSFAYTYQKLVRTNPGVRFRLHMFKDCERKTITKLFRHRQLSVQ